MVIQFHPNVARKCFHSWWCTSICVQQMWCVFSLRRLLTAVQVRLAPEGIFNFFFFFLQLFVSEFFVCRKTFESVARYDDPR